MLTGWKTLIFGLLTTVVGFLQAFDWQTVVSPTTAGYILAAVGVVVTILRYFTTTPITKSSS